VLATEASAFECSGIAPGNSVAASRMEDTDHATPGLTAAAASQLVHLGLLGS
jgi:hypothetical protein